MAEQRVKKSPPFPRAKPIVWTVLQAVEWGELESLGPQPADGVDFFHPEKHLVHGGRRGLQAQRNLE